MMKYRYIPGDRPVPVNNPVIPGDRLVPMDNATYVVLLSIEANWSDRDIPETAFFQNEEHRDRLLELGWLVRVQRFAVAKEIEQIDIPEDMQTLIPWIYSNREALNRNITAEMDDAGLDHGSVYEALNYLESVGAIVFEGDEE